MLKLNPQIMVSNGQNSQSLITKVPLPLFPNLGERNLQKLILQQNNGKHDMLERILMAVELTEHGAEVEVGVG